VTASLIHGDHVSCSRVGGTLRCESARLRRHTQSLVDALRDLAAAERAGAATAPAVLGVAMRVETTLAALRATADDLDEAGAALQRYATDLAEGHEVGRRAERRVEEAGLLLQGTRVTEPWGPASASAAERRLAQLPEVQSRVDLATAHIGRARGRLTREMTRLTEGLSAHSRDARRTRQAPVPPVLPLPPVLPGGVGPTRL
jgi:hypothetical protein